MKNHNQTYSDYVIKENKKEIRNQTLKQKRSNNGAPFDLYIELLIVTDYTIFQDQTRFSNLTNTNYILLYMRTYFAHYVNGVKNIS